MLLKANVDFFLRISIWNNYPFQCYTILSVHERIKWSRTFGRALIATSQTLTSPVACLWKPPPPPPAFPPHPSFPIPSTEDWWLWVPFRMRSKWERGERTRHENEWEWEESISWATSRGGVEERQTRAAKTTWWKKQTSPFTYKLILFG